MAKKTDNRRRFYWICFIIGISAGGALAGFLRLSVGLFGAAPEIRFQFYTIMLVSLWLGMLAPQWMVRVITGIARSARSIIHSRSVDADGIPLLLPGGRVDFQAVSMALAGSVVLWVTLSLLATFTTGLFKDIQVMFSERFFLNLWSLRIIDAVLLAVWMFPVWFAAGLVLALLYRFTLSSESGPVIVKPLELEQRLPLLIVMGIVLGYLFWQVVFFESLPPSAGVWLAQLMVLVSIMLVVVLPSGAGGGRKGHKFQTTAIDLNYIPGNPLAAMVLIIVCGVLMGGGLYIWSYLGGVIYHHPLLQKAGGGFYFIGLLIGYFLATRPSPRWGSARTLLAVNLLLWAAGSMIATILITLLWQKSITPRRLSIIWFFSPALAVVILGKTIVLGKAVYYSKMVAQAAMMSRMKGWIRWLSLFFAGILIARLSAHYFFLPAFGSLMVLTMLILLALLGGGLTVIYYGRAGTVSRRLLIIGGFLLVGVNSVIMPWASRHWLRLPGSTMKVVEEAGAARTLLKGTEPSPLRSVTLNGFVFRQRAAAIDDGLINHRWFEVISHLPAEDRILIMGMDENIWPPAQPGQNKTIHYILPRALFHSLDAALPGAGTAPVADDRSSVEVLGMSWFEWVRQRPDKYDLIWLHNQDQVLGYMLDTPLESWYDVERVLRRDGRIIIFMDSRGGNLEYELANGRQILWHIIDHFRDRGGLFYVTSVLPDMPEVEGLLVCFWPDKNNWHAFLDSMGYGRDTVRHFNRHITMDNMSGRFVSFAHLRAKQAER